MFDDDPWASAPKHEPPPPRRPSRALPVVAVIVSLFILGVVASLLIPWTWFVPAPPRPQPITQVEVWKPAEGPLVRGLPLEGAPQALTWSPNATQLAWSTFDEARSAQVIRSVGVGQAGFSATQELESAPVWMQDLAPSVVTARVEEDTVVLYWASGPNSGQSAGVVDLRGLLGLQNARTPAVVTFGPTTRLAVVAWLSPEAKPTLHVFDVTALIEPPRPASPTAPAP